jgi:hypothetical protein
VAGVARRLVPGRADGSVTLDEDDVEAIAERVLELLRERDGREVAADPRVPPGIPP